MDELVSKNRIDWIDICKAIAIYIMVLGHVGVSKNVDIIIHAFHMPIFFIISGYCFNEKKNNNIWNYLKKSFFRLIIPYFIFGIVLYGLSDLILYFLNRREEILSIKNLIYQLIFNTKTGSFGVIQWFLTCLFFTQINFCIICKICKNSKIKYFIILSIYSILAYLYPKFIKIRLPFALDCSFMSVVFYGLGWSFKKLNIEKFRKILKNHIFLIFLICCLLVLIGISLVKLNNYVNMRNIVYGNYFLFLFNSIYYSFLLIVFSNLLDIVLKKTYIKKFFLCVGKNTLSILLLNQFVKFIFYLIILKYIEKISINFQIYFVNIIISYIIIIVCILFSIIIKKYCPYVLGEFKNNKK